MSVCCPVTAGPHVDLCFSFFKSSVSSPGEPLATSGDALVAAAGCGVCLPPVAEARDAAQHPAIYRTVPTAQDYLAPSVSGAQVEKLKEEGVPEGIK